MYTAAALETDLTKAGTTLPTSRIHAYLMQGRAHVALGHVAEGAASFESAAEEAHRYGFFLWEVFALRDLKLLVLDEMGHGEHGSRRLGAAVRALKADRAGSLRPMLKGLDATELLSLPAPDTSYRVVYKAEDSSTLALRQELVDCG